MRTVRTHYDTLHVGRSASLAEIKVARRRLHQKHHPDKNPHDIQRAERRFRLIEEAYKVLAVLDLRREHDDWIARTEGEFELDPSTAGSIRPKDGKTVDSLYEQAVEIVLNYDQASISLVQRHLRIGYKRAKRMMEMMQEEGLIFPSDEVIRTEAFQDDHPTKPLQKLAESHQEESPNEENIDKSAVAAFLIVVVGGGVAISSFGYGVEVAGGIALTLLVRLFIPDIRFHRSFILFVFALMIGNANG